MKSDVVFALENAGWPVLLVDAAGTILRASIAAVKVFGPVLEGEAPLLSAIWAAPDGSTAEQFLAQWERSPSTSIPVKLKVRGGGCTSFIALICSFNKDSQKYFVLQLTPENLAASCPSLPAAPSAAEPVFDTSFAHKQKLECALQLARSVSLDFNNALTSILGHASLLLTQTDANNPIRSSLLEIEKSAAKAAEIANDLGAFSRQEKEPRSQSAGNLNLILQRSVEVVQRAAPRKIQWVQQLERRLFAARFDETKMHQAFVKIFENCAEAIQTEGRIVIQTRNVTLAEPAQDRDLRLAAGTYVCVEIADSGCGISDEVLPRIFEPFFTTKKDGAHRGLGLAWVYGIITNHGGGVAVSTQLNIGTSVRVYLPAQQRITHDSTIEMADLNGTQTILMVDDEELLLTMGQTVLSAYGYKVLTASSGPKAIEILSRSTEDIDLLITDLVMPAMSGRELVEHIQQLSPQTRILCTSGFVRPAHDNDENSSYLQKPFTSQELLVKVKHALTADAENA